MALLSAHGRSKSSARAESAGLPVIVGRVLFGFAAIVCFMLCEFWFGLKMTWGPATSASLAVAFFVVHVALLRRRVGALDPVVWIPVSLLLFQFGMCFAIEVIGYDGGGLGYDAWHFGISRNLGRGYCAALLTMLGFVWGIYLAGVRDLSRGPDPSRRPDGSFAVPALIFMVGSLLMTLFGIILVGPSNAFGTYGDWWAAKDAGVDQRFLDVGVIFTEAGIFAVIASAAPRQHFLRGLAYTIALVIIVITVSKGDRSSLIGLGIGLGWCYSQSVRRIRWVPVLASAFCMLVLIPVIAEWRSTRTLDVSREATIRELVGGAAYSMGSQVNAFVHSFDYIPRVKGYAWGYSYFAAVVNAIPNVMPTKGANPLHFHTLESSPSNWLSSIVAPEWYRMGGGYGYAMGAELYYNFGMPGVLLGSLLLGYITGRVRNSARVSPIRLVASAVLFGAMAILVRNTFGYPFKLATWPVAGLFLVSVGTRVLRRPGVRRLTRRDTDAGVASALPDRSRADATRN